MRMLSSLLIPTTAFAVGLLASATPQSARADEPGRREGGQVDFLLGVSGCLPGPDGCKQGSSSASGAFAGYAVNLGYRVHRHFFIGAGHSLGFFGSEKGSKLGVQNAVLAVIKGYLRAWRFDFGFELSPGWSRVSVRTNGDGRIYSQGFALRPGVSADFWLNDRLFVGLGSLFTLNFHKSTCIRNGSTTTCNARSTSNPTVHQYTAGIHIGGTF